MGVDVSCLYSTVRNTSGKRKTFGFLPPHGRTLDPDEEFTCFGDIRQAIIKFERSESRRSITAFEAALRRDDIEIISTTNVILEDIQNPGVTQMLTLRNGTLGVEDPCWEVSSSLSDPSDG